jgi:hypothetical protein
MRRVYGLTVVLALALLAPILSAQMEADRVVPGGGVFVQGWKGKIPDAGNAGKIDQSKFSGTPASITINSGPPAIYWNPANTASGDYTVKATFTEAKVKSANSHAHPYGVFIAGNKLDTDQFSLIYCSAYGERNRFIVRTFGPAVSNISGRGASNPAVKAAEAGGGVTQEIAMSVKGGNVSCTINGTEVSTHPKAEVVGAGKLEATDGIFGIRVSHNTDVVVTGLTMTKG